MVTRHRRARPYTTQARQYKGARMPSQEHPTSSTLVVGQRAAVCPVCDNLVRVVRRPYSDIALGHKQGDLVLTGHTHDGLKVSKLYGVACLGSDDKAVDVVVYSKQDHEYEPGEITRPMHTDPMCAICGEPEGQH